MNCEDFESHVNDLARKKMAEASIRARALAHSDECAACAKRLEDESALSFKLRSLATETSNAPLPPLGSELLAALRSNRVAMNRTSVNSRWRYWAAAAVAAMVLLLITVAVIRSRSLAPATVQSISGPSGSGTVPIPNTPEVVARGKPELRDDAPGNRRAIGKRRNRNQLATKSQPASRPKEGVTATETATSITPNSATEITTDFMPVGYASATNMQDGGQLVRVELPRSALVAFGLPMNVDRYNEKVKADVFFGADGMARAIRFVQ